MAGYPAYDFSDDAPHDQSGEKGEKGKRENFNDYAAGDRGRQARTKSSEVIWGWHIVGRRSL